MAKLRWGVIGAGGIADRRTIPEGIIPAKNAKLTALMSVPREEADALGAKYKVPAYSRIEDLLADKNVDAVYIATPTYLHKQQTIAAARAGKHVLCEKPMALNVRDARAMLAACDEAGVKLGMGFMMRFNVYHQHFQKLISQGKLGDLIFARAQLTCWYPCIEGAWRQDPKLGGGGAIMDLAVHCVDVLEMLLGPAVEVTSFIDTRVHDYPADDTVALMLRFRNGAVGFVDCAFNIPDEASENVLELQGTKGCIKAKMTISQGPGGEVVMCSVGDAGGYDAAQARQTVGYAPLQLKPVNTYQAQIEAFSKAVLNNAIPPVDGRAGVHNMLVMEAAFRASRTRRVQSLKD